VPGLGMSCVKSNLANGLFPGINLISMRLLEGSRNSK
jgi:hypothetical protein